MRLTVFQRYRRKSLGALQPDGRIVDLQAAAAAWLSQVRRDPFWERETELRLPPDVGQYLAGGGPSRELAARALDHAHGARDGRGIGGEPLFRAADEVTLLAPLLAPLVISTGAVFRDGPRPDAPERKLHREFFLRDPFNLRPPGEAMALPGWLSVEFDAAPRLAVVIGSALRCATPAQAEAAIFGYLPAIEVCARDNEILSWAGALFHIQYPHSRAFDGALAIGPAVVSKDEVGPVAGRKARLRVDGVTAYAGPLPGRWDELAAWICRLSESVTLKPGTLLIPGSADDVSIQPARTGNLPVELVRAERAAAARVSPGQRVAIDIDGVGGFESQVIAAPRDRES